MQLSGIKRFFLGKPLRTTQIHEEKLPKWKALATFSSDALSSVAYATQEILIPLSLVSVAAMSWSLPVAAAIGVLLLVVSSSYLQTIRCYPSGGGAYIVSRENLGTFPGLVAGAALLIDYVLTAAVSVTAGVESVTSAVPELFPFRVWLGCGAVLVILLINLRGIRESGTIFSVPTYLFIVSILILLAVGFYKLEMGTLIAKAPILHEVYPSLSLFLILRAFSSGCAALTGVEAISNGVQSFREPRSRNARITLIWMVVILGSFFMGITALAHILGIYPKETETLISQIAEAIVGRGFFYYVVQFSTALILFLAANTSFADFPQVSSLLAHDRFLPRQLASLGDRLVYSKGIMSLGFFSGLLIILFQGATHALIPLYAIGVFLSFTLSQSGMVIHHLNLKEKGWRLSIIISALGAVVTFIVLLVISVTKFMHGAWIVLVLIPGFVFWFRATREHYRKAAAQLALSEDVDLNRSIRHVVILPISGLHKGTIDAIKYAKSIASDVRILSVELEPSATERLRQMWDKLNLGLPLYVLPSPYRSIVRPILDYIRSVDREREDDIITVVIPEFVTARWWESIYHNQTAFLIRAALLFEPRMVVTSVRYHLSR